MWERWIACGEKQTVTTADSARVFLLLQWFTDHLWFVEGTLWEGAKILFHTIPDDNRSDNKCRRRRTIAYFWLFFHPKNTGKVFPSKDLYPPWNKHSTWKWMVGRWVSFWEGIFSGAMLVSGRVINGMQCFPVIFVGWSGHLKPSQPLPGRVALQAERRGKPCDDWALVPEISIFSIYTYIYIQYL